MKNMIIAAAIVLMTVPALSQASSLIHESATYTVRVTSRHQRRP